MESSKQWTFLPGKEARSGGESDEEMGGMLLCLIKCAVSTPVFVVTVVCFQAVLDTGRRVDQEEVQLQVQFCVMELACKRTITAGVTHMGAGAFHLMGCTAAVPGEAFQWEWRGRCTELSFTEQYSMGDKGTAC